jgi:hypothetical protein
MLSIDGNATLRLPRFACNGNEFQENNQLVCLSWLPDDLEYRLDSLVLSIAG